MSHAREPAHGPGRAADMERGARPAPAERMAVGLCAECHHAQRVASGRGSVFWRCRLSARDAAFARYPRLPVLRCSGYEPAPIES